jgi:hypothetical protein
MIAEPPQRNSLLLIPLRFRLLGIIYCETQLYLCLFYLIYKSEEKMLIHNNKKNQLTNKGIKWLLRMGLICAILITSFQVQKVPVLAATNSYNNVSIFSPGSLNKKNPGNGATNQPQRITLTWDASSNATSYQYCINTIASCTTPAKWISNRTKTSVNLRNLTKGVKYYWQVRSINATGITYANGRSTAWWSFLIAFDTIPTSTNVPTIVLPTNTNVPPTTTPTLTTWPPTSVPTNTSLPPTPTSTNTGIPPTPQTTSTPIIPTIDPTTGRPGYLQSIIDTISGSIITRVVDDSWGAICRHHYSKDQAWNADQTVIWLNKGCDKFIDGNTYALLPNLKTPPDSGGESRWSPIDRNVIIYTSGSVLGKWNPFTGTGVIIRTFSGYSSLSIGEGEGNMSNDGKFIALYSDVSNIGFAYDMVNNIKYPDINFGSDVLKSLSMSSLGNYLIANINNDNAKIFNLQGVQVGNTWSEYGCPSHYDFTVDQNGDEVAVGVCKTGYKGIVKRRLADGQITVIFPMGASHTSARNIKRPGWVYVSGLYYAPYLNDVLAIKIDGTGFEIIANVPWIDDGIYESERHASPSLDGTKVIIATNWGIYDGSSQSFVIKTNK